MTVNINIRGCISMFNNAINKTTKNLETINMKAFGHVMCKFLYFQGYPSGFYACERHILYGLAFKT